MKSNSLGYQVELRTGEWEPVVYDGVPAGTVVGITAVRIFGLGMGIQYRVHVENLGWLAWTNDGEEAGAPERVQVEALQFRFTDGIVAGKEHIWGRVVSAKIGAQPVLLPFLEYGEHNYLGTTGKHLQLERLQLWKSTPVEGDAAGLPLALDALTDPRPHDGIIRARWAGDAVEICFAS